MVSGERCLTADDEYSTNMKEMIGGCCVCSDERGWAENPLVYCDGHGCNVAVHQGKLCRWLGYELAVSSQASWSRLVARLWSAPYEPPPPLALINQGQAEVRLNVCSRAVHCFDWKVHVACLFRHGCLFAFPIRAYFDCESC